MDLVVLPFTKKDKTVYLRGGFYVRNSWEDGWSFASLSSTKFPFVPAQEKSKQKSDPHFSSCTALCIPIPLPPWKPEKQHILVLVPALRDGSPPSEDGVPKLINLWCCGLNGFPPSPSSASTSEGD